jgi:hypothetical protein
MNLRPTITKIQIVIPSGLRSGGPESLHNLAFQLQSLGVNSQIVYFPYGKQYEVTLGYENYIKIAHDIDDKSSTLIIFPETFCMLGFSISNATVGIWWLSVDHFTQTQYHSYRDFFRYLRLSIRRHRPYLGVRSLKKFKHFSKSQYDEEFLSNNSIIFSRLTGPIASQYINNTFSTLNRKNIILYNPKKGMEYTSYLKDNFSQYKFVSLESMNTDELITAYANSKIYIDFGNHPGKERMPREAVALGCCIITGLLGSASNALDIPIPRVYKINTEADDFLFKFQTVTNKIFSNFELTRLDFNNFRNEILNEPAQQLTDLKRILSDLGINYFSE